MTVRADELLSASGDPAKPEAGRIAPLQELVAPDGVEAIANLTSAQRRRLRKKMRSTGRPLIACEGCGWEGLDVHLPWDPQVTPCPECGHLFARLAAPPVDGPWWD